MSAATKEQELEQAIQFLASEMREVKKTVEQHTHHIEQLRRSVVATNELLTDVALQAEVDELKLRVNEIQAKSHRKFRGTAKGPIHDIGD
jgi:predicted RNase H-like nuclease (RuvC/YqgF family)